MIVSVRVLIPRLIEYVNGSDLTDFVHFIRLFKKNAEDPSFLSSAYILLTMSPQNISNYCW